MPPIIQYIVHECRASSYKFQTKSSFAVPRGAESSRVCYCRCVLRYQQKEVLGFNTVLALYMELLRRRVVQYNGKKLNT